MHVHLNVRLESVIYTGNHFLKKIMELDGRVISYFRRVK